MSCERKLEIVAISKSTMACYSAGSLIKQPNNMTTIISTTLLERIAFVLGLGKNNDDIYQISAVQFDIDEVKVQLSNGTSEYLYYRDLILNP